MSAAAVKTFSIREDNNDSNNSKEMNPMLHQDDDDDDDNGTDSTWETCGFVTHCLIVVLTVWIIVAHSYTTAIRWMHSNNGPSSYDCNQGDTNRIRCMVWRWILDHSAACEWLQQLLLVDSALVVTSTATPSWTVTLPTVALCLLVATPIGYFFLNATFATPSCSHIDTVSRQSLIVIQSTPAACTYAASTATATTTTTTHIDLHDAEDRAQEVVKTLLVNTNNDVRSRRDCSGQSSVSRQTIFSSSTCEDRATTSSIIHDTKGDTTIDRNSQNSKNDQDPASTRIRLSQQQNPLMQLTMDISVSEINDLLWQGIQSDGECKTP